MHRAIFNEARKITVIIIWLLVWNKAEDVTELTHTYVFHTKNPMHHQDLSVVSGQESTTSPGKLFQ